MDVWLDLKVKLTTLLVLDNDVQGFCITLQLLLLRLLLLLLLLLLLRLLLLLLLRMLQLH
jgi:hypothetical protein